MANTKQKCTICGKSYSPIGINSHMMMHTRDMARSSNGKILRVVHDGDCPKCGFPETVYTLGGVNQDVLREECSKKDCYWSRKVDY